MVNPTRSSIRLPDNNDLSSADRRAFTEARELVGRLEAAHPQNPDAVRAAILKSRESIDITHPTAASLHELRVSELASAYAPISDGKGGIAPDAHANKIKLLADALNGRGGHGGLLRSQQAAWQFNFRNLLAGALLTGVTGLAAAAEPNATPADIGDAMANSAVPGYGAYKRGDVCKAFGELAGVTASGAAMTATASIVVPAAITASAGTAGLGAVPAAVGATLAVGTAGTLAYEAVTPAAESTCNTVTSGLRKIQQKFGF